MDEEIFEKKKCKFCGKNEDECNCCPKCGKPIDWDEAEPMCDNCGWAQ